MQAPTLEPFDPKAGPVTFHPPDADSQTLHEAGLLANTLIASIGSVARARRRPITAAQVAALLRARWKQLRVQLDDGRRLRWPPKAWVAEQCALLLAEHTP